MDDELVTLADLTMTDLTTTTTEFLLANLDLDNILDFFVYLADPLSEMSGTMTDLT